MTDVYTQESASKKKFLAPLLVILLCMVSLTAAGYAYSATVTNTDDSIVIDGITMELYDQDDLVTSPMYTVNDIHIGTHTSDGYALKYGANGFYADPASHSDATFGPQTEAAIKDDFKPGYYVEVTKGETPAGVNTFDEATDLANATAFNAAVTAKKLLLVGDEYTLKVNNQNMDASKDVKLSFNAKWKDEVTAFDGLLGAYVVIFKDGVFVAFEKVDSNDTYSVINADLAADINEYTIKAYVAITDYYSASAPADLVGDGVTGFFNEKFSVAFTAETVASA